MLTVASAMQPGDEGPVLANNGLGVGGFYNFNIGKSALTIVGCRNGCVNPVGTVLAWNGKQFFASIKQMESEYVLFPEIQIDRDAHDQEAAVFGPQFSLR